jgi:hypothetical protein
VDGDVRDPVFAVREGRRWDANVLLGYGSYEQARVGLELAADEPVRPRAHHARLELVESMKSSRGEYTYTVPELFGESIDGTANSSRPAAEGAGIFAARNTARHSS